MTVLEHLDRRVLGAIRFLDANTRLPVSNRLAVEAAGVRLMRNRRSYYVIFSAPGLESHTTRFERPPNDLVPGSVSLQLSVTDIDGQYLPRRGTIELPLDPDPANADKEFSLFRPVDIDLYPSAIASPSPGAAVIRATVKKTGTQMLLAGALIRVLRAGEPEPIARGLTNAYGEALVNVPGIPVTTWGEDEGDVVVMEVDVTLRTIFDKDAKAPPDPDDLQARRAQLPSSSTPAKLAAGRVLVKELFVTFA
jgi:hypothetical protein